MNEVYVTSKVPLRALMKRMGGIGGGCLQGKKSALTRMNEKCSENDDKISLVRSVSLFRVLFCNNYYV
jgi:predicted naringenin-chalcone synthase